MPALTPRWRLRLLRRSSAAYNAETDDELRSTWPQRAWTLAAAAAILSSLATSASLAAASRRSAAAVLAVAVAAVVAFSLADVASGVYHWAIDNYGDGASPVFGAQIAAFQSHHRYPSSITFRDPCNNLHVAARPVAAHAFAGVFAACVVLSQQFHAWAHEKPRMLPAGVGALQAAGVLVSRSQHAGHHRPPYRSSYCIVSGMWNPVLDRCKVFEALETAIYRRTGVRPRSWASLMHGKRVELAGEDDTAAKAATREAETMVWASATARYYYGLNNDLFGDDSEDSDFEGELLGDVNEGKSYPILEHD
ncbi:hypothetical protein ACP4OV_026821 [Aristida adscensionis]